MQAGDHTDRSSSNKLKFLELVTAMRVEIFSNSTLPLTDMDVYKAMQKIGY